MSGGRPTTYGPRTTTAIRFETELHERLREAAAERDVSVNWLVTRAVEQLLDRIGGTEPVATPAPRVFDANVVFAAKAEQQRKRGWFTRKAQAS